MLGVFGNVSKAKRLGFEPSVVYVGLDRVKGFDEHVVPLVWVPRAFGLEEGVVDVYDRRYLFAFGNSGCLANPRIVGRAVKALEEAYGLGYRMVMLDAVRLPSPYDSLFFFTTCFCRYSLELYPELTHLGNKVKEVLLRPSVEEILYLLEELAYTRSIHVENILSILYDKARELGIELVAAVFPYPLSKYVGQEPRILKRYVKEIHVMLYHKCSGAACLNTELARLARALSILGLDYNDVIKALSRVSGLEPGVEEVRELDHGIGIHHIEKLMEMNRSVYGDMFTPILWMEEKIVHKLKRYMEKYQNIDIFIA